MASPPLVMTPVPAADVRRGDGKFVAEFVEQHCRITKESLGGHAGELLRLRPWQRNLCQAVYARRPDGRFRHRQALIGLPRKNGKSALGSSFGLYGLVMGSPGAEVYSCAADKEQARIVFGVAKSMVEADPDLAGIVKVYRDALEYAEAGSIYKVLSSEAFTKEGLNPTLVIYDELHAAPTDELYNVMTLAMGARVDPMLVAITTAGVKSDQSGGDSTCYRLWQYGKRVASGEVADPSFFMAWWGAADKADHKAEKVWAGANPGFGDLIDPEDFVSVVGKIEENDFRTKRMNQWVSSQRAWLPAGSWDACRNERAFVPGGRGVVLGFDGSRSGDTTALVAVTVDIEPQVRVLGLWEKPPGDRHAEWKVPRGDVKDAIRQACRDYQVREIAADEYIWSDALEELGDEGLPVVIFPQTLSRMGPATQRFYEQVQAGKLGHDGNPALARHLGNATIKTDTRGQRLAKDAKDSPRKIDLAVAAVMAVDRAAFWLLEPLEGTIDGVPISEVQFVW